MIPALWLILFSVLLLPFLVKKVEKELELFLLAMGTLAVTITGQWEWTLAREALTEPVKITLAVLVAGLTFRRLQGPLAGHLQRIVKFFGIRLFLFCMVLFLALLSSVVTAIIAALILVEVISNLQLNRRVETALVVITCFAIGLGAALTPLGEPLSTLVVAKLRGEPFHADFWFLLRHFWPFVFSAVFILAVLAAVLRGEDLQPSGGLREDRSETVKDILLRTVKVYAFIVALVFLGSGFKPFIDLYISKIPFLGLYWINMISAILDNATLVAAELGPGMSLAQIKAALLGLLISGGMLIPGNIPNIISAGKLGIKSKEWARVGLPLGLILMGAYFIWLLFI